ncbi:MAG: DciA family protein [Desulfuromonas sp.]|jgi:hypothetical protein|nr:DUF721 domain-containing protein [Desulfuromonas thiophila]MDD3801215.1 DUF721 domain-containing protein [Desulfuromonas thiophila]MDY0397429.1 DUF721 domain-containing protein [Desulfuromonas thiophila]
MSRNNRGRATPERSRDILNQLFGSLGIRNRIEQHAIWQLWDQAVGRTIACHARPVRLRQQILEVEVDHPVWMQQLQLLKPRLLASLNAQLGDHPIEGIFLRRRPVATRLQRFEEHKETLPELNSLELAAISRLTAAIADPQVRTALQRLIQAHQRRHKAERLRQQLRS